MMQIDSWFLGIKERTDKQTVDANKHFGRIDKRIPKLSETILIIFVFSNCADKSDILI
jgi:hypothetical protein